MIKVTLDSNTWLSGIFWIGEAAKLIELVEKGKTEVFVSKDMLVEISDVLQTEKKFQIILEKRGQSIKDAIDKIIEISNIVKIKKRIDIVKEDPDDNKILECAASSKSKFLISYDSHLLKIREYKGIKIIHPTDFLKKF